LDKVEDYWNGRLEDTQYNCPSVSLFRLFGSIIETLDNKDVFEIGFAHGADLIECYRRRAKFLA